MSEGEVKEGQIKTLKEGFGFIECKELNKNLFFFWSDVMGSDFNALKIGDKMKYRIGKNEKGDCAKEIRKM